MSLYGNQRATILVEGELTDKIEINPGVKQEYSNRDSEKIFVLQYGS